MTNNIEMKIIGLLEEMNARIEGMDARIESMDARLAGLEEGQKIANARIANLEEGQKITNAKITNLEEGRTEDRGLIDIIATQVGKLTLDMKEVKNKLDQKADKTDIVYLENTVLHKIEALFDGQQLHSEKLEKIVQEVSRHEEVILRKVKY